jgi:nucleotide-binding universal stress UspA family protein
MHPLAFCPGVSAFGIIHYYIHGLYYLDIVTIIHYNRQQGNMFERILLPLDGSELAETVLPYGEELARRLGSELILFHVHAPERQQYECIHRMYLDRLAEAVAHNIRKGHPEGTEGKVTTIVAAGEPVEDICKLVEENNIGLIIMTAVSASGLRVGKMLGGVTDHVCRAVPIPVMLIRPQALERVGDKGQLINHILIPLDGSDLSRLALPVGEELATKLKASMTLFQMAHIVVPYDDATDNLRLYGRLTDEVEDRVRAEMIALQAELKEKGLNVTQVVVTVGLSAAEQIIEVSKSAGADLVVMSTHGRSGLRRWVFGSVAERVLRHLEIPLLLVHARAG